MLLKPAAPNHRSAAVPDAAVPGWRRALRHFGAAVLAVALIALAVGLLALPVAHAQARPALRTGDQPAASPQLAQGEAQPTFTHT